MKSHENENRPKMRLKWAYLSQKLSTVSHLGGVRQTARHRRCFNELWKFTKFCAQNSWKLNERTKAFRENWFQSFFFAFIFYCNSEVIFMYLYFWYMRSIMTFYIKNCTFLYYFIQYLKKKIKATLPFITVPGQLVQRHLVQGRLIQGCLVQRQKVKTDTWSKGHLVQRTEGTKTDGPIRHLVQ